MTYLYKFGIESRVSDSELLSYKYIEAANVQEATDLANNIVENEWDEHEWDEACGEWTNGLYWWNWDGQLTLIGQVVSLLGKKYVIAELDAII